MTTLHLGVIDIPYSSHAVPNAPRRVSIKTLRGGGKALVRQAARQTSPAVNKTTGDVAEILEERYHIMEVFFRINENFITDAIGQSLLSAFENVQLGAPASISFSADAMSEIEKRFKTFLSLREMDGLGVPGVPTKAGKNGVSHRFKHPYAKRDSRPSFIDTGLYQASFKAWSD